MKKMLLLLATAFVLSHSIYAQRPIQEFNFNGNRSNTENSNSFLGYAKFVTDRAGVENSAIRLINNAMEVTLPNLPLSNSPRTISIWIKYNDITTANYIWSYSSSNNEQYLGLFQEASLDSKSDLNLVGLGTANDAIIKTTISENTWYNYSVTYDGLTTKIYRNGELIKSSISSMKLNSGIVFALGKMGGTVSINADIDDLKIYNVALSSEEVAAIYNNSPVLAPNNIVVSTTDATKETSQKGSVMTKKNTAIFSKSNVVISDSQATTTKFSEVFSTKGIKVISSSTKNIDISTLPEGTYMLKVSNAIQKQNDKNLITN